MRFGWWVPPLLAVQFLTRVPVPGLNSLSTAQVRVGLASSMVWSPVVGGLIGASTVAVLLLAGQLWPAYIAVVLCLIIEARLTGALHEDAVADFCDAFGGGLNRDRTLEIMKDSRVGSYGALALVLAVALRAGLLWSLVVDRSDAFVAAAVIAAAALGRWACVSTMAWVPPVPVAQGLSKDIGIQIGGRAWVAASLLALPAVVPFAWLEPGLALLALSGTAAFLLWFRRLLLRRLAGVTGDCLGFAIYAVQLIALLAASSRLL